MDLGREQRTWKEGRKPVMVPRGEGCNLENTHRTIWPELSPCGQLCLGYCLRDLG